MHEPTILCPHCKVQVKLTESLAAPLIQSTRKEYERQMAMKEAEIGKREAMVREQQAAVAKSKESIDEQVAVKLKAERVGIAAEEAKKARFALSNDLEQKARELTDLQNVLKDRDTKLAEAQKAQVELIRKQRELDDAKREMDLRRVKSAAVPGPASPVLGFVWRDRSPSVG